MNKVAKNVELGESPGWMVDEPNTLQVTEVLDFRTRLTY